MIPNTKQITYKEALASGLRHYFTAKPCKNGHVAQRYVANRQCEDCLTQQVNARRAAVPELIRAQARTRYAAAPESERSRNLAYYRANIDARSAYAKRWGQANQAKKRQLHHKWSMANPGKVRARSRKREMMQAQRVPKWADLAAISDFYVACPAGFHVDHIIPLRGKLVSGLHVLENLQYLTKEANLKKQNKFNPADYTT